ncbi:glutamate racemase [Sessilibacter sp. MAH1]
METPFEFDASCKKLSPEGKAPAPARSPTVLVFDSGVGGLSIAQALVEHLPYVDIVYAADNQEFPYGTKTESELVQRIDYILHAFQKACSADLIVVACNTASTIALPSVRQRFHQPIVGVVPAIKPAASLSHSKTIGLLATPGTISRDYTDALIQEFAHDCTVIKCGSRGLVEFAEQKIQGLLASTNDDGSTTMSQLPTYLIDELQPLITAQSAGMDTVVLACTHFPLVKAELQRLMPEVKHWVDSSKAIARRVEYLLHHEFNLQAPTELQTKPNYRSLFSAQPQNLPSLLNYLSDWFGESWSVVNQ